MSSRDSAAAARSAPCLELAGVLARLDAFLDVIGHGKAARGEKAENAVVENRRARESGVRLIGRYLPGW
jgi:hypothetical protein